MPKLMIEEMDKVWFNFNTGKVDNNINHRKESVISNMEAHRELCT